MDKYTARSRGFGFVQMPNSTEAKAAMVGLNGKEIDGRAWTVNEARERAEREHRRNGYSSQGADSRRQF